MITLSPHGIEKLIYIVRNQKVMLDSDLAELYEVETKYLNRQVKRNGSRFPSEFIFQLTKREFEIIKSQNSLFKGRAGARKYPPYVFTEYGVAMLSGVINSDRAVKVNIAIIKTFIKIRQFLASDKLLSEKMAKLEKGSDKMFRIIFERLNNVENKIEREIPDLSPERRKIGL